jgi:glucose-1-phosphate thymidylyltransferase
LEGAVRSVALEVAPWAGAVVLPQECRCVRGAPAEVLRPLVALDTPGLPVFRRADLVEVSNFPADRIASFALLAVGPDGYLQGIVEKPDAAEMARAGDDGWVSMNLWRFDARIFGACRDVPRSARGEYELPVAVGLALERGVPFKALPASGGILDLSSRSDVLEVSRRLGSREVRP